MCSRCQQPSCGQTDSFRSANYWCAISQRGQRVWDGNNKAALRYRNFVQQSRRHKDNCRGVPCHSPTRNRVSETYHLEKAILSAAKVVYLVSLIESESTLIEKYNNRQLERIKDWQFNEFEYTKLNKLKKSNPEAFFYLYQALHNVSLQRNDQ